MRGKQNWIDAADYLIISGHHSFDLTLVKKKL